MTPEMRAYLNHIMSKARCCNSQVGRYCGEGLRLKLESDARFVVDLKTVAERRSWMQGFFARKTEHMGELERLVRQKFEERKG